MIYRSALMFAILLSPHGLPLSAQEQIPDPVDTVRIDTDLVNLSVSVFGRNVAQATPALRQKEFTVLENGAPQEISFFASAETPFDLVLLLDLSGSTADKLGLIRKSARRFVDATRPTDRVGVVTFSADVQVVSLPTLDHEALKKSIDGIEKPRGGTNFWDALRFALEHVLSKSRAEHRRNAVIVMTDGVDNALPDVFGEGSTTSFPELLEILHKSDAIVLPIYLDTEKEAVRHGTPLSAYALARQELIELAAQSGNSIYRARKVKDLDGVYAQVVRDLGVVYSLGYRPANRARDGAWRSVAVQLAGHPELLVRAKAGYYAK